jgi:hypothetical protein
MHRVRLAREFAKLSAEFRSRSSQLRRTWSDAARPPDRGNAACVTRLSPPPLRAGSTRQGEPDSCSVRVNAGSTSQGDPAERARGNIAQRPGSRALPRRLDPAGIHSYSKVAGSIPARPTPRDSAQGLEPCEALSGRDMRRLPAPRSSHAAASASPPQARTDTFSSQSPCPKRPRPGPGPRTDSRARSRSDTRQDG